MPVFASSSAFSLPHNPMCATIHQISRVLVDPSALRDEGVITVSSTFCSSLFASFDDGGEIIELCKLL